MVSMLQDFKAPLYAILAECLQKTDEKDFFFTSGKF